VAVAQSCTSGVVIYLRMTSRLTIVEVELLCEYHERHCDTGAESDVYECFSVLSEHMSLSVLSHVFGALDKTSSLVIQRMVK